VYLALTGAAAQWTMLRVSGRKLRALPIDFDATSPPGAASEEERVRSWPLWVLGLTGATSVGGAIYLDLVADVTSILPSVLLELGAGIFLFAFLFWAERRVIRREVARQTRALIEALTGSEEQARQFADDPHVGDVSRFAPDGPIDVAFRFVAAMTEGRYEDAWDLADDDWKLCRAQSWLWNNRDHYGDDVALLDLLALQITLGPNESEVWQNFAFVEEAQFKGAWREIAAQGLGVATHQRRIAPDYEIVLLTPLGEYHESGFVVREPALIAGSMSLVIHTTSNGSKVASHVADAPPRPGWPPSWWAKGDPALKADDSPSS
jgi:hypothetical protein